MCSGEANIPALILRQHRLRQRREAINHIVQSEGFVANDEGMRLVVELAGPMPGNGTRAVCGAEDAGGGGGGAVIVHAHGHRFADQLGEIVAANTKPPYRQRGIVDRMHRVHAGVARVGGPRAPRDNL